MNPHPLPLRALDAVVRVLRWHRRSIAAAAAFLAVWATVGALQPHPPASIPVVAAARDLASGTVLAGGDLVRLQVPADVSPSGAVDDPGVLIGRVLNGPVTARSPITSASVAADGRLARPGYVVLAVPLRSDALAGLLRPGATVDLIGAGKSGIVAAGARVVAVPAEQQGGVLSSSERAVLVEVPPADAPALAAALDAGTVTFALR